MYLYFFGKLPLIVFDGSHDFIKLVSKILRFGLQPIPSFKKWSKYVLKFANSQQIWLSMFIHTIFTRYSKLLRSLNNFLANPKSHF